MSEKHKDFDDLQRLLKLKRHEIPPPGFFNNFSGDVIARIRAGEEGGEANFIDRLRSESPFWGNLLHIFNAKPGAIGGFATCLCLLVMVGVVLTDRSDPGPTATDMMTAQASSSDATDSGPTLSSTMALAGPDTGISVSTNPVASLQPVSTLFGSSQNPLFQPAGFVPASQ